MFIENKKVVSNEGSVNNIVMSLVSGAISATICDFIFYPVDTIKTRLQSEKGFMQSGGFKRLYLGMSPVMMGAAPAACLFFISYEGTKEIFEPRVPQQYHSIIHMSAASVGEVFACFVRVPVEVIKQRRQALLGDTKRLPLKTLYRGFGSTAVRDMPFCIIQMPLWEYFKLLWSWYMRRECTPLDAAACGALSVAISAGVTTPLDVAKTRIMLSSESAGKQELKIRNKLKEVYQKQGIKGLFSGFTPRIIGFTASGFVFFGLYEKIKILVSLILSP